MTRTPKLVETLFSRQLPLPGRTDMVGSVYECIYRARDDGIEGEGIVDMIQCLETGTPRTLPKQHPRHHAQIMASLACHLGGDYHERRCQQL
jgi:hypothetical protein